MWKNIGKKIKTAAKIFCWIGILGSFIGGIATWVAIDDEIGLLFFLLIAVVGSVLFWIGSFCVYGFGELVDKTCEIRNVLIGDKQIDDITKTEDRKKQLLEKGLITEEEYERINANNGGNI